MLRDSAVLTAPPAVELGLQPGDRVLQRLVLLLLFLPLALPLLGGQLHVQADRVLDGLRPGDTHTHTQQSTLTGCSYTVSAFPADGAF